MCRIGSTAWTVLLTFRSVSRDWQETWRHSESPDACAGGQAAGGTQRPAVGGPTGIRTACRVVTCVLAVCSGLTRQLTLPARQGFLVCGVSSDGRVGGLRKRARLTEPWHFVMCDECCQHCWTSQQWHPTRDAGDQQAEAGLRRRQEAGLKKRQRLHTSSCGCATRTRAASGPPMWFAAQKGATSGRPAIAGPTGHCLQRTYPAAHAAGSPGAVGLQSRFGWIRRWFSGMRTAHRAVVLRDVRRCCQHCWTSQQWHPTAGNSRPYRDSHGSQSRGTS